MRVCMCVYARARARSHVRACVNSREYPREITRERDARAVSHVHTSEPRRRCSCNCVCRLGMLEVVWRRLGGRARCLVSLFFLSLFLFLVPSHSRHFVLFLLLFSGRSLSPSLPRRSPRHPSLLSPSVVPPNRYLLFLSSSNAFHLVAPCPASSVLFSVPVSPSLSLFETPAGTLFLSCREGSPILSSSRCVSLRLPILFLCLSAFSSVYLRLSSPTIVFLILED